MTQFHNPDQIFFDRYGNRVSLGKVYFGEPNTDPKENPKPPFSDSSLATAIDATQTLTDAGKLAQFTYLDGDYSILCEKANGDPVFLMESYINTTATKDFDTVAEAIASEDLVAGDIVQIKERGNSTWDITASGTADGFSVLSLTGSSVYATLRFEAYVPREWGAAMDGTTDDHPVLSAIADAAATEYALGNRNIIIDFEDGYYALNQALTFIGLKYAEIRGTARFISTHSDDFVLKFDTCNYLDICGHIFVQGNGSTTYSDRQNLTGVLFDDCSHITGNKLEVWYTKADGVRITGQTSQPDFKTIQTAYCGSGVFGATSENVSTFTSQTQSGTTNSAAQRSVITCNTVPQSLKDYLDASLDTSTDKAAYLEINDQLHFIESYSGSTVTVWPWVDISTTTGETISWIFGAGVFAAGSDTSVASITHHDAIVCGLGYVGFSLYPAVIGAFVSQNNGVALLNGTPTSGAALGMTVQCGYFESNTFDYVQGTQADASFSMLQTVAFSVSKCERLYSATTAGVRQTQDLSDTSIVLDDGQTYVSVRKTQTASNSVNLDMWKSGDLYIKNNTATVQINDDANYKRLFERKVKRVSWFIDADGMTPTGALTFTPPAGGTINGLAADAAQEFNTASGPVEFLVSREDALTYYVEALAASTVTKA